MTIDDGVTTVAISPDNRMVAAGSLDKSVRVWDTTTGFLVERLEGEVGHRDSVYSVAFAPSGRELVSGSLDKTIKMWELNGGPRTQPGGGPRGGKCIRTFEGHRVSLHHNELHVHESSCGTRRRRSDMLTSRPLGLRTECRFNARRHLGAVWIEGPWSSILGSADGLGTTDAARTQELR